jgi:hypothetical protein
MNRENIFFTDSGQIGQKHIPTSENDKMATGGNVLLAPNGEPSGLYFTEIYNLVRTPEFKNWFGDWEEAYRTKDYEGVSKIIDENGEPLICVHNTPNEFYEFDEYRVGENTDAGFYGKGFYFTPNVGQSRYGEIELNCFLNIKNPFFKQSTHRTYELKTDELESQGYDGVVVYPNWLEDFNFENGVDRCEEVVAYHSEQIKLGDGRNTTFDPYNADIRFENGGEIDSKVEKAKAELLKAFPTLNSLDFLGKGRFGYSFLIDINYELYVVKYTTSLTEFWATKMAMVSNAPHVVKFLDAKQLSEQFTYGIIHEYVNRDGMINEDVWNYALLKADGLSPRKQGLNIDEIRKKVPPKALEYEINLVTKLVNELKSFFGTDLDLLQQNWGYNSNGELVLFDIDGNIKKAQYLEWMEKYKSEPKFAGGGSIDNTKNVKPTEDLIQLVKTERERAINEWRKFEKVVVGRNDGYWWYIDSSTDANFEIASNPSRRKILEIIKNNPSINKLGFQGTIKVGSRVGEELEIVDDFSVTLWSKNNEFFKEGMTFEFSNDNGKYRNTIVNKNETEYKDRLDKKKFVYYKSVDKYGNVGEARTNKEVLKEDFENGNAFFVDKMAGGGNIDINEPFYVNGKTLAERVRILLKQLYPDYKWSVTSSYNKLDVYLLEADFDPFSENWKEAYPTRELYYNVNNRDLRETNREDGNLTDRAIEVFKPIREYIDRFVYNRNADDPYADYSDYNIYEYTYIGKWDKPYVQVAPKTKKGKKAVQPTVQPTATPSHTAIKEEIKIGTTIAFAKAYLDKQDTGLARQMSEEYAFLESVQNSGGKTEVKVTFVNVPKSPNISYNYSDEQIFEDYVKATVPLFKTGDMVVKKSTPNKPQKIKHRAYYQQIGVKYSTLEKRFLLSGMYWNYELEDGTYANEGELELYSATHSIASYTTPNDVFTIQNIVSKTPWSEGLKSSMTTDFIISGYEDVRLLIGANKQETSNAIQKKVDGFASEKNTYLQANMLAEIIHKLIDTGNVPFPATTPSTTNVENTFLNYLTANTEKANEITKELEVTSSLAMFVMGSKDIANLDSKKYAELMEELLKKFPKLIEDDSTNAN